MYKVICENLIVDLIKDEPIYIRYQNKFNRAKPTDKSSAQGFVGSNNKTVYIFPGNKCPGNKTWKTASLEYINEAEYNRLFDLIKVAPAESQQAKLSDARDAKICELKNSLCEALNLGVSVRLSDSYYHQFSLKIEDQLNLALAQKMLDKGVKVIPYHANGSLTKLYSAEDMQKIIDVSDNFRSSHLAYYNILKYIIENMYNINDINNIKYGVDINELPVAQDLKELYNSTR